MKKENAIQVIDSFYEDIQELNNKKAEYFDKIAKLFFDKNFGSANKSEIELLMFSIFMDEMIEHNKSSENVLDYKACSDYRMSEILGIPSAKIRTLKIKKQSRYPVEFSWQNAFLNIKNSIIYDENKNRIIIPVSDPNLYLNIKNFIEENDGYIEIQRGNNVLQMRPEHFFILLYLGVEKKDKEFVKEEFIKKLKEKNKANDIKKIKTDQEMIDNVLNVGDNVMEFLESIIENMQNPLLLLIKGIRTIGKTMKKAN